MQPTHIVSLSSRFLSEWEKPRTISYNVSHLNSLDLNITSQEPPPPDYLKINVYVAFHNNQNLSNSGSCAKDSQGDFVLAFSSWQPLCVRVLEGEALGLLKFIWWAIFWDMTHVIFEIDCKRIVDRILETIVDFSKLGIVDRILEII